MKIVKLWVVFGADDGAILGFAEGDERIVDTIREDAADRVEERFGVYLDEYGTKIALLDVKQLPGVAQAIRNNAR